MPADLKTSILVNRQVPEFIRDEYPKFISFIEAYYEFLEAQANTATTSNNLITTAKSLRNIADVDESLDQFEKNFYNTYATLVPLEVQSNKALLFKQLLPLYKSKGSESSFKLLFQLVFGEDIEVILPKNNVLRPSASVWQVDSKLRINPDISSRYIGNGTNKVFYLAQQSGIDDVNVFVDNVLKTPKVDYFINREYRQLNFVSAPSNNAVVLVNYDNFNIDLLNNRKVTGLKSGSSAIVESASKRTVSDTLNLGLPVELFINQESLTGPFLNGELVSIPINDEDNNTSIDIIASTFSIIRKINVLKSGNNYSVGDIVSITGGNASVNAFGTIETVVSGKIESTLIHHGGALFTNASPISVSGNSALTTMIVVVDGIDLTGANAANSFTASPDVVSNLSLNVGGTVYVNSSNFGAVFSKSNISAKNTVAEALNYITIAAGPISNVRILTSSIPLSQKFFTVFDAAGAEYGSNTPYRYSKSLKSIGRYKINAGGTNYKVGDEIVFGTNPLGTYGQHAAAVVGKVAANGYILRIDSANSRIRGTASVNSGCNEITGTGTFFTQDLRIGDVVDINGESRIVTSNSLDTTVVVSSVFTYTALDKKVGVYNRWPLGGYGYEQNNFPSISVSSATGSSASVEVDSLIGDGERLEPTGFGANGEIVSIKVVNPGSGYEFSPIVNISGGDGTATANAEVERSYAFGSGRWLTSDSIISSAERKIQGEDYYVDYSYVISSKIEFSKYKTLLKQLLHPTGLVNYSFYNKETIVELTDAEIQSISGNTISGTVNVGSGRILVTGVGTKFNIANTRGILSIGSSIAVNGELRKINTILSNTALITTLNVSQITIGENRGDLYSNGYLVFSGGGGQVTSLTITAAGSGYENGTITFSGTDEAVPAVANVEVFASNGVIRYVTLISGGLYENAPTVLPDSNPHRVVDANSIRINVRGQGYSNGYLVFSGGSPLRDANVRLIVHPNTVVNTVEVIDSGLYQSNPTAVPNSSPNVVISTVTVNSTGNGHSNGVLVFSGGDPARAATVRVETFPPNSAQVHSITANSDAHGTNGYVIFTGAGGVIAANARVYVNSTGAIINVAVAANGLYTGTPTATVNTGNAVLTLQMKSLDGQIRKVTIVDPGLYLSAPTAVLNTSPNSVISVTSNTVANTYVGRSLANGYLIFSGGLAVRPANATYNVFASNGGINMQSIIVTDVGLYRIPPTSVTPNVVPVSVTQALTLTAGAGYSGCTSGYLIFSTNQGTANTPANCLVTISGGAITSTVVLDSGLYANGQDIIVVGVLNPATETLYAPSTPATFSIGYNANTLASANLVVTTSANAGQTASVTITASSNSYTSAVFTITPVANSQTNAVITVGFTGRNTAANASVEVYNNSSGLEPAGTVNGAIRRVTINSNGNYYYTPTATPNSVGSGAATFTVNPISWSQTANAQTAIIFK